MMFVSTKGNMENLLTTLDNIVLKALHVQTIQDSIRWEFRETLTRIYKNLDNFPVETQTMILNRLDKLDILP